MLHEEYPIAPVGHGAARLVRSTDIPTTWSGDRKEFEPTALSEYLERHYGRVHDAHSNLAVTTAPSGPSLHDPLDPERITGVNRFTPAVGLRAESFDAKPAWTGRGNRRRWPLSKRVDQSFGYCPDSNHAGGKKGEIGGKVWRATNRVYYARPIATRTFEDSFSASGKFAVTDAEGPSGVLFGLFNSEPSAGWRHNNSLAFRIDGEKGFYRVYCEYGTRSWLTSTIEIDRATNTQHRADGTVHEWSLSYDPMGNDGGGSIRFVLDDSEWILDLRPGHKEDGAAFDRFGLWNRQTEADSPLTVYLDDVVLDGEEHDFAVDPRWIGEGNRKVYRDREIEPRHDFGYRESNHAGGARPGEMGGILWRTEWWKPWTAGYFADTNIGRLTLENRLHARGKMSVTRTSVDSGIYLGWFNTNDYQTLSNTRAPKNFIGAVIEGRSRVGQKLNAAYHTGKGKNVLQTESPKILPNRETLTWSIDYDPNATENNLVVTVEGVGTSVLTVPPDAMASFNAFGMGTPRRGGHWIEVFLDDIIYTVQP